MHINRSAIVLFLSELRRSLRLLGLSLIGLTLLLFLFSGDLLLALQQHIGGQLHFFSVAEPFLSHVKLAFFAALFLLMPFLLHVFWRALAAPFGLSAGQRFSFVLATSLLFYGGAAFCYLVTLPFGIQFLLGFEGKTLAAVISINRFTNFISVFVLAFGLAFELPVFMVFCARAGLVSRRAFERNRRYAILAIAILAAVLTPTPDVVNMGLMGLPLYFLYEAGIVLIRIFRLEKRPRPQGEEQEVEG